MPTDIREQLQWRLSLPEEYEEFLTRTMNMITTTDKHVRRARGLELLVLLCRPSVARPAPRVCTSDASARRGCLRRRAGWRGGTTRM